MNTKDMISYVHRNNPTGTRYRQYAHDAIPSWAFDVQKVNPEDLQEKISLWGLRHTFAWGWRWKKERDCYITTADEWLALFRKDEPLIQFILAKKKPKL
jgi:hypothetical protein